MGDNEVRIWVVVPCYNEAKRLSVGKFLDFSGRTPQVRFLWVDDGSADETAAVISDLADKTGGRTLVLPKNVGKAEAVRQGILSFGEEPDCDAVGFWDADLSTPPDAIMPFFAVMRENGLSMVMGSRWRHLGNNLIERRWYRHAIGRIFAASVAMLLRSPVYDTQCGAKLFRPQIAARLFRRPFATRWFFDVELLKRLKRLRGIDDLSSAVWEIPLRNWCEIGRSKVNMLVAAWDFLVLLLSWRKSGL